MHLVPSWISGSVTYRPLASSCGEARLPALRHSRLLAAPTAPGAMTLRRRPASGALRRPQLRSVRSLEMVPEREEAPAGGSICGPLIAASIGVRLPLGFTNLRMLPDEPAAGARDVLIPRPCRSGPRGVGSTRDPRENRRGQPERPIEIAVNERMEE